MTLSIRCGSNSLIPGAATLSRASQDVLGVGATWQVAPLNHGSVVKMHQANEAQGSIFYVSIPAIMNTRYLTASITLLSDCVYKR